MKHTKGPWIAKKGSSIITIGGRQHLVPAAPHASEEEYQANAALIAAAPEMYNTLKHLSKLNIGDALVERIEKVLKKAGGQ